MWGSQRFKVGTERGGVRVAATIKSTSNLSCVVLGCLSLLFFAHINLFLMRKGLASRGADFREDKTRSRRREERKFRFALKSGWVGSVRSFVCATGRRSGFLSLFSGVRRPRNN
jgi:hypothetical protein